MSALGCEFNEIAPAKMDTVELEMHPGAEVMRDVGKEFSPVF